MEIKYPYDFSFMVFRECMGPIYELNDDLLGLKEDGTIKGGTEDLVQLFKSVYIPKSN